MGGSEAEVVAVEVYRGDLETEIFYLLED